MKIAVGIMTHNAIAGLRLDLLERTIETAHEAFPMAEAITVYDNRSTDGTPAYVKGIGGQAVLSGNGTPGSGRNVMLYDLWASHRPEVFVLSDDDMAWARGAGDALARFFASPDRPADVGLVSGLLEPEYPWNTPRKLVEAAGVRVLLRDSAPGCAWAIPIDHFEHPARREGLLTRKLFIDDFGYDHAYCQRLATEQTVVGQLDLAEHLGWEVSTHGNRANRDVRSKPLDRQKWGI